MVFDNRRRSAGPARPEEVERPVASRGERAVSPAAAVPSSPGPAGNGRAHLHIAALVDSPEQLLTTAAAFVDEGLRAGDLVVLACPADTVDSVRSALGERAGPVEADHRIALAGTRPPDAFTLHDTLLERAARSRSGRLRVLGQVVFGGDEVAWREGERYESAANAVLGRSPLTAMCLYDRSVLSPAVIASARATHPLVHDSRGLRTNPGFQEPIAYVRRLPVPREPVEARPPVFDLRAASSLAALRHALRDVLAAHVPDEEQFGDLYLGVSEVAANAFRHGRRPVSARVWADGTRLVCTVTDAGRVFDDPLAGFVPARGRDLSRGGMGLWLARKLFDSVDLLPGDEGFTVRLSTALRASPADTVRAMPRRMP
jgi:anti-sigma regulatory factor (Ser/Thr protein kinase)